MIDCVKIPTEKSESLGEISCDVSYEVSRDPEGSGVA